MQDPSQIVEPEKVLSWLLLKHPQNVSRWAHHGTAGKCHGIDANFPDFGNWLYNRISLKYLGREA